MGVSTLTRPDATHITCPCAGSAAVQVRHICTSHFQKSKFSDRFTLHLELGTCMQLYDCSSPLPTELLFRFCLQIFLVIILQISWRWRLRAGTLWWHIASLYSRKWWCDSMMSVIIQVNGDVDRSWTCTRNRTNSDLIGIWFFYNMKCTHIRTQ